jgi:ribosome-interacting GTPase 1
MPINVNDPEYTRAEQAFHEASSVEDQLMALNKMISHAPSHKGAENLRQQLTTRRKKLEAQLEKKKKSGKSTKVGIRKEDMQAIIVGNTNVGKSSLLKILTNAQPLISEIKFTTNEPQIGMMDYENSQVQIIEIPAIDGEHFDKSIAHTADTVLIMVDKFEDIEKIKEQLYMITGKTIIVFNKSDQLNSKEKRKLKAKLQTNKYNFEIISCIPHWPENGINDLKKKIFSSFDISRIYTKEPGKERSPLPVIMKENPRVKDVAEKILKGFSKRVKKVRIWGPGSKFGGQIVGLNHRLKDLATVEFTTK